MEKKKSDRIILKMEIRFLKARVRALRSLVRCLPGGKEALAEWSRRDSLEKEEMTNRINQVLWGALEGFRLEKPKRKEVARGERFART